MMSDTLMTKGAAARACGVTRMTITAHHKNGRLIPAVVVPGVAVLYLATEVEAWRERWLSSIHSVTNKKFRAAARRAKRQTALANPNERSDSGVSEVSVART